MKKPLLTDLLRALHEEPFLSITPSHANAKPNLAFSLVELSIVLVILGLLVGGILSGQALIRASELRSVTTEAQRYITAINSFKDRYFAIPGDMTNATIIWGKDNVNCPADTGTTATPGTCNGNGDGTIETLYETYRFWQHLANAGLVAGSYTGFVTPMSSNTPAILGTDIPAGKMPNSGWQSANLSQSSLVHAEVGYSDLPDVRNNYLLFGAYNSAAWSGLPILTPNEAWNIDTKVDDGKPAFGKVRAGYALYSCATGNTKSDTYNLSNGGIYCTLGFIAN